MQNYLNGDLLIAKRLFFCEEVKFPYKMKGGSDGCMILEIVDVVIVSIFPTFP